VSIAKHNEQLTYQPATTSRIDAATASPFSAAAVFKDGNP
jgi:hypothetical protein